MDLILIINHRGSHHDAIVIIHVHWSLCEVKRPEKVEITFSVRLKVDCVAQMLTDSQDWRRTWRCSTYYICVCQGRQPEVSNIRDVCTLYFVCFFFLYRWPFKKNKKSKICKIESLETSLSRSLHTNKLRNILRIHPTSTNGCFLFWCLDDRRGRRHFVFLLVCLSVVLLKGISSFRAHCDLSQHGSAHNPQINPLISH